jgi:hypothetical protein
VFGLGGGTLDSKKWTKKEIREHPET